MNVALDPNKLILSPKDQTRILLKEAAAQFNVTPEDILSESRRMPIVEARHYFWYLLRRNKGWNNKKIAETYNVDTTTVRSALKNFRHKFGGDFAPKSFDNENISNADWCHRPR